MKNRAEALSLLTELRGRLDELEQLIYLAPDFVVLSPAIYDQPGVETLTPAGYLAFRKQDATAPQTLDRYELFSGFVQFGAPGPDITVSFESFALSDLHRAESEQALGLRLVPQGERQKWFTYEFLAEGVDLSEWEWVEWVLKLSFDDPFRLHPQFLLNYDGKVDRVTLEESTTSTFATFLHFRLDRIKLEDPPQKPARIRLVLGGGGGRAIPLTLYQFGIYGKRLISKGDSSGPQV
ncbi:MAG: hypothetical protein ACOH2H_20550 [Cypionkella sp.]